MDTTEVTMEWPDAEWTEDVAGPVYKCWNERLGSNASESGRIVGLKKSLLSIHFYMRSHFSTSNHVLAIK